MLSNVGRFGPKHSGEGEGSARIGEGMARKTDTPRWRSQFLRRVPEAEESAGDADPPPLEFHFADHQAERRGGTSFVLDLPDGVRDANRHGMGWIGDDSQGRRVSTA